MIHSSDAQQDPLLTPSPCLSPPLPFMKLSSKLNPNLCFWGKGNYDSRQHLFMNLSKWGVTSYLESTLSLNFSSCRLGNLHNGECFISYLMTERRVGGARWSSRHEITIIFYFWEVQRVSLVAQLVKNPLAMWETWIQSLGWEDSLEKATATHSSILAWRYSMDCIIYGVAKS